MLCSETEQNWSNILHLVHKRNNLKMSKKQAAFRMASVHRTVVSDNLKKNFYAQRLEARNCLVDFEVSRPDITVPVDWA